jgi:ribonuclease HII
MRAAPSRLVCGVDEAGRGPIAGPVMAAAVLLDDSRPLEGLRDSKLLSPARRAVLADQIRQCALAGAVASASVEEIDRLNILQATLLAMSRAVDALSVAPQEAWIDGNRCPRLACAARAVIGGDRSVPQISAASILAKTARDAEMMSLHQRFPCYGLDRHKGYPTREHLAQLARHGASAIHRRSFGPVKAVLAA